MKIYLSCFGSAFVIFAVAGMYPLSGGLAALPANGNGAALLGVIALSSALWALLPSIVGVAFFSIFGTKRIPRLQATVVAGYSCVAAIVACCVAFHFWSEHWQMTRLFTSLIASVALLYFIVPLVAWPFLPTLPQPRWWEDKTN